MLRAVLSSRFIIALLLCCGCGLSQADVGIVGVTWMSTAKVQAFVEQPGVQTNAPGDYRWITRRVGFQRGTPIGASMCEFNERASVPISSHKRLSRGESAIHIEELALDRVRCERVIQYGEIRSMGATVTVARR